MFCAERRPDSVEWKPSLDAEWSARTALAVEAMAHRYPGGVALTTDPELTTHTSLPELPSAASGRSRNFEGSEPARCAIRKDIMALQSEVSSAAFSHGLLK